MLSSSPGGGRSRRICCPLHARLQLHARLLLLHVRLLQLAHALLPVPDGFAVQPGPAGGAGRARRRRAAAAGRQDGVVGSAARCPVGGTASAVCSVIDIRQATATCCASAVARCGRCRCRGRCGGGRAGAAVGCSRPLGCRRRAGAAVGWNWRGQGDATPLPDSARQQRHGPAIGRHQLVPQALQLGCARAARQARADAAADVGHALQAPELVLPGGGKRGRTPGSAGCSALPTSMCTALLAAESPLTQWRRASAVCQRGRGSEAQLTRVRMPRSEQALGLVRLAALSLSVVPLAPSWSSRLWRSQQAWVTCIGGERRKEGAEARTYERCCIQEGVCGPQPRCCTLQLLFMHN